MQSQYQAAWEKFKSKDSQARLILTRIHRAAKQPGRPYLLSPEDISVFNQAREAWFEFLRVARR